MENELVLDFEELVKYIKEGLTEKHLDVSTELIEDILDLEAEYMIENGFATVGEE